MKNENFTPDSSLSGYQKRLRRSLVLTVKKRSIFYLIGLFSVIVPNMQGQTCKFTTDKPVGTRGCAPFRVVVKNKCINVDHFAFSIPYQGPFQFTGDSLVLTFENGAEESLTTFVIGCFDSNDNIIDYQEFDYKIDPLNPVSLSSDTITLGEPIELDRSAGLSFITDFGDGTVQNAYGTISHYYTNTGTYHLTIPVHACVDTQRFIVNVIEKDLISPSFASLSSVIAPKAKEESMALSSPLPLNKQAAEYVVYPNPASKYCILKMNNQALSEQFDVGIYNNTGGLVLEKQVEHPGQELYLPLDNLASGVYFLKINDGVSVSTYPLIKQ